MKKIFTLMSICVFAGGMAYAAPAFAKDAKVKNFAAEALKRHEDNAQRQNLVTRALPTTDIIENAEGQMVLYYKNATGFDYYGYYESEDGAAEVVFGDNNDIYFKDIMSGWGMPSFVKGEIDGDVITMELPQTVADYGWYGINLTVLKYVDEEEYEYEPSIKSVSFKYDPETKGIALDLPGEPGEYILGYVYTDDESWCYSGDLTQEYRVFDGNVNKMPEGMETEVYMLNDGYYGHGVNIGFDGDTMYIEGLSTMLPNSVITATVDGNIASISQDQIVGALWGYFAYVKVADNDGFVEGDYNLTIDAENKIIKSENPDVYLVINASLTEMMYFDIYADFTMKVQESFEGTPLNPYGLEYSDDYAENGISIFLFAIPNISTEGNVLDSKDLYYRVFVDGELYEFESDPSDGIYEGIEGTVTEVPFEFDNGWDLYWYSEVERVVYFYFVGAETFGVQSVYNYDGVVTESEIMTLDIASGEITGVENLIGNDIKSVTYYDLSGRKVANPQKGIYIQRAVAGDGSIKTRKVVIR